MPDREKVIKGLNYCTHTDGVECPNCPYWPDDDCVETLNTDILALLKGQEAVKPVRDKETGRIWLCGNCGTYVGFEDNDPGDPNEFDKYCRVCGHPVLWEGR